LRDVAEDLVDQHRPDVVLIEDASTGIALAPDLKKLCDVRVELVRPEDDKVGRVYVNQAKFEQGLVHFPRNAAFIPVLEAELLAFPHGKADDQVDSISQALSHKYSSYNPGIIGKGLKSFNRGFSERTW
jgi:predicted phage terminase large subunit-like protein